MKVAISRVLPCRKTASKINNYLHHATLGLSKIEKEETWNELEEHIFTRAEQLQVLGLTSKQAYQQVLQELGLPLVISAELNKVHNMRKLILVGLSLFVAGSLGVYAWNKQPVDQVAQVYLENKYQPLIKVKTLEPVLRFQHLRLLEQKNVDGKAKIGNLFGFSEAWFSIYNQDGQKYVDAAALITNNTKDVQIKGFLKPQVASSAGHIQLETDASKAKYLSENLYQSFAATAFAKLWNNPAGQPLYQGRGQGRMPVVIETKYQEKDAVALFLMTKEETYPHQSDDAVVVQNYVAFVGEKGRVQFKLPFQKLQFVSQAKDLKPVEDTEIPTALLIKVSDMPLNQMKAGVFVPESKFLTLAD